MSRSLVVFYGLLAMLMGVGAILPVTLTFIEEGGLKMMYHQNHGTREIALCIATAVVGLLSFGFSLFLFHFGKTAEKP